MQFGASTCAHRARPKNRVRSADSVTAFAHCLLWEATDKKISQNQESLRSANSQRWEEARRTPTLSCAPRPVLLLPSNSFQRSCVSARSWPLVESSSALIEQIEALVRRDPAGRG